MTTLSPTQVAELRAKIEEAFPDKPASPSVFWSYNSHNDNEEDEEAADPTRHLPGSVVERFGVV